MPDLTPEPPFCIYGAVDGEVVAAQIEMFGAGRTALDWGKMPGYGPRRAEPAGGRLQR